MQSWIIDFMGQFGYLSVFLLMALENIFPPIPSEIILAFGGFMTTNTKMTMIGVIVFATAGSVLGAIILYKIGYLLNAERLEKIINRWGHILRIKMEDIHKASDYFKRFGCFTVFFCRMVPLVRSLISIPAGMSRMKFSLFLLYSTLGTLIWNTLLVFAGASLGASWDKILVYFDTYSTIAYCVIGLLAAAVLVFWVYKKKKNRDMN